MGAKILLTLCILAIGVGWALWDQIRPPSMMSTPAPIIEDTPLALLDGSTAQLHDYKGKVIVLNIWATWCPPCVAEFPQLLELAARHKDRMVLIFLSVDEQRTEIIDFLKRHGWAKAGENVVYAHDPDLRIAFDRLGVSAYPETFIIGPDLRHRRKVAGVIDWSAQDIQSLIEE